MLPLTDAERNYLLTATERTVITQLEIWQRGGTSPLLTLDSRDTGPPAILPGGSVRVDTGADVLRTAQLTIADPDSILSVGVNGTIGMDKQYRLYKGYDVQGQGVKLWPLGVYELSAEPRVGAQDHVRTISLQLGDKSSMANRRPRGGLQYALRASQGLTKLQAIRAIAAVNTWGETQFNLWQDSTAVLDRDLAWEDTSSPWQAAQDVNSIVEPGGTITRLYYDAYGRLTLTPDPGPSMDQLPAIWEAKVDPDKLSQLLPGASKQLDLFKLTNAVQVKWGSQQVTPGVYWSVDTDPNSPTNVNTIGWCIFQWKNGAQDELIRNLGEATARADFERRRRRSYEERVTIPIVENPALDPWDVVYVKEPLADMDGKFQILSYTISLDESLTMQCEGWAVRRIA